MPADILGDIQRMGRAEPAGEKAAPAYRRAPSIQDFIQNTFYLVNIPLHRQWHVIAPELLYFLMQLYCHSRPSAEG
jgi:hypothetical protein